MGLTKGSVGASLTVQLWGGQQLVRGVDLVPEVPGAPSAPQHRGAKPLAPTSIGAVLVQKEANSLFDAS